MKQFEHQATKEHIIKISQYMAISIHPVNGHEFCERSHKEDRKEKKLSIRIQHNIIYKKQILESCFINTDVALLYTVFICNHFYVS
jgi:hypothetical protein